MNDRVSNAPPPTFLGPDEMAAYERQFYADSSHTRSRPTSGSEQSFNRTSGSKFWEGIRDKFTRTKSSSSITTVSSSKSRASNRFSQQSQQSQVAPACGHDEKEKENVPGYYPSREEVMQNYKSLVDAGFFSSHAIQGTRHQPPPSWAGVKNDHALPAPPPPPPTPFSQLVAQKQRQSQQQSQIQNNPATPALSSIFASIPYSATQPSPTGDAPLMTYARPDPRPPISLPKKYRRPHQTTTYQMAPPPTTPSSPYRGTKRAVADMTGGSVDREMANAGSSSTDNVAEAGARKLVKKLRKSASRISADLSLRPATSAGNGSNLNNHPYGAAAVAAGGGSTKDIPVRSAASSTSVNLVPRPPISSAGRAMGVVRSLSNSFKRDGGTTTAPAAPGPDISAPAIPQPTTALPPNKLLKARRSISRRVSLGRSRSGSISSSSAPPPVPTHLPPPVPCHLPPPVPPHRSQPPQRAPPAPPTIIPAPEPAPPRASTTSIPAHDGGDPMVLDELDPNPSPSPSSPSKTRNPSLDVQPGGLTVPSFHYPQRQKKVVAPLAASPNRGGGGGPVVGQQQQQHHHHVKNGSFCFGTPAAGVLRDLGLVGEGGGGVRDVDKENYAVY